MWKNYNVGACPCYPTKKLLETLGKVVDQIEELGVANLAFKPGDLYKNIDKAMEDDGFKKLGEGVTRLVYEFKDDNGCQCVVKVAKSKASRESNYDEVAVMVDAPEDIRDLFLGLRAADERGWWVTQPKATLPERSGQRYVLVKELESKLEDKGWHCMDLHEDNVGLYANTPVIVNYGFGLNCTRTGTRLSSKGVFKAVVTPTSSPESYKEYRSKPNVAREEIVTSGQGTVWPTSSYYYEGMSEEE